MSHLIEFFKHDLVSRLSPNMRHLSMWCEDFFLPHPDLNLTEVSSDRKAGLVFKPMQEHIQGEHILVMRPRLGLEDV